MGPKGSKMRVWVPRGRSRARGRTLPSNLGVVSSLGVFRKTPDPSKHHFGPSGTLLDPHFGVPRGQEGPGGVKMGQNEGMGPQRPLQGLKGGLCPTTWVS